MTEQQQTEPEQVPDEELTKHAPPAPTEGTQGAGEGDAR